MAFNFGASTPAQQQAPASTFFSTPGATTGGFGGTTPAVSTAPLFGGVNPATSAAPGVGFGFNTTATSQAPQTTGFGVGGIGTTTTSVPSSTGFSFGGTNVASAATASTGFSFGGTNVASSGVTAPGVAATAPGTSLTGTMSFGGLGGVASSGGNARISTLALGTDPGTGWTTRNDNRAVQELPVPPEIIALVEELKNQMKNQKTAMADITRAPDLDMDSVAEQIEEVRVGVNMLTNVIHKQELQTASLIKDMQELSKDMDLLQQSRDVPAYGYGGTSALVMNFLYELVDKYTKRMMKYKVEIERAELTLQTLVEAYSLNAKDLWASLTTSKDTVVFLAAQIQQLHEEIRNELTVHRNLSQFLLASTPKPWLTSALSGNVEPQHQNAPPLERIMSVSSATTGGGSGTNLETVYNKTYAMFGRVPSLAESRVLSSASSESILRGPFHGQGGLGHSSYSPSYHPSGMGSYIGPSSGVPNVGLKRSKQ